MFCQVLLGIFAPPSLLYLDFKTEEELHWQPQTEEEMDTSELAAYTSSEEGRRRHSSVGSSDDGELLGDRKKNDWDTCLLTSVFF